MSEDKTNLIYDLLKSDRDEALEFRKEVRGYHRKTDERLKNIEVGTSERLSKIEALDEIQNEQLTEHIRRTDILEKMHKDNKERIRNLEKPRETVKMIVKWSTWAGAILGVLVAVGRLMGWI